MRTNSLRNASQLRDEQQTNKKRWLAIMARIKMAAGNKSRTKRLWYMAQHEIA